MMGFNKATLSVQPTTEKRRVLNQPFFPHGAIPSEPYLRRDENGDLTYVFPREPEWEGQLYVYPYKDPDGNRTVQMYVAVEIEGTLVWKEVAIEFTLNSYTGKPIDHLYG